MVFQLSAQHCFSFSLFSVLIPAPFPCFPCSFQNSFPRQFLPLFPAGVCPFSPHELSPQAASQSPLPSCQLFPGLGIPRRFSFASGTGFSLCCPHRCCSSRNASSCIPGKRDNGRRTRPRIATRTSCPVRSHQKLLWGLDPNSCSFLWGGRRWNGPAVGFSIPFLSWELGNCSLNPEMLQSSSGAEPGWV